MLLAIRGYADLLVARTKDDDGVVRYAHEIVAAAERATGLTRQLLAFGRRQMLAPEVFDLNDLPAGIASMLELAAYAMICVSDHGTGMDPDTLHHVFEPFFSTKDATRGTGLGLSTVHGVATQSGGAVGVQTEAGRGSTFTIFLPLAPTGA